MLGQSVFLYTACDCKLRSFKMYFLSESSILNNPKLRSQSETLKTERFGPCLGTVIFGESFFLQDAVPTPQ